MTTKARSVLRWQALRATCRITILVFLGFMTLSLTHIPVAEPAVIRLNRSECVAQRNYLPEISSLTITYSDAIVRAKTRRRMNGAARITIGAIAAQAISQEPSQWTVKVESSRNGMLAIAAAMAEVIPDWMTAKTKWL